MNPWDLQPVGVQNGGPLIVPREHAPLAPVLPYRRAIGEAPPARDRVARSLRRGWSLDLGRGGFGDAILALGMARALVDATGREDLYYHGPRPRLMERCTLPLRTSFTAGEHVLWSGNQPCARFEAVPEQPSTWLDLLNDGFVEVHSALPMRYYLKIERAAGIRLPADRDPLPRFTSGEKEQAFHVAFVSATSRPDRKDYGVENFRRLAEELAERAPARLSITLVTGAQPPQGTIPGASVATAADALECLDIFASAQIVIGNDTGLTHLAALTRRSDGTGPDVISLYGRHAHTKWTTGSPRHHSVTTPFSQMMALADRCPVRDGLEDAVWAQSSALRELPATAIADFAAQIAAW